MELLGRASDLVRRITLLAPDVSIDQIAVASRGELERHFARRLDLKQPELVQPPPRSTCAAHPQRKSATDEQRLAQWPSSTSAVTC